MNATSQPADEESESGLNVLVPFMVALLLLIAATVASNCFVYVAVYTFRELRTVTNYFVLSLATADIAVAVFAMPVWLMTTTMEDSYVLHLCTKWVDPFCCMASIASATLVSLDRYYAINKPLRYKTVITPSFAKRAIAIVWGVAVFIAAISFLQFHPDFSVVQGYIIFLFVTLFCLPLAIMSYAYFSIYKAAIAQISKMEVIRQSSMRSARYERRKKFYRELRITKTLTIIVSLFLICWSPFLIITLLEAFTSVNIPVAVLSVIVWLPYLLSCANPWIYTGMNRDFRKAFKQLYCLSKNWCGCHAREKPLRSAASATAEETLTSFGASRRNVSLRKVVTVV